MTQAAPRASTQRRAEMVHVAARLFSERGYHGTSMKHLADALGMQKGSLYAHIGAKQDLLFDVVDEGAERFLARGREAAQSPGNAARRLERMLTGHITTAIEHIDAATVFLNEWRYLTEPRRSHIQVKRDLYEDMVRSIVAGGIAGGEFRADADVRFGSLLFLSAGNWVYAWYRPTGELSPGEVGRNFARLIIKGLQGEASQ